MADLFSPINNTANEWLHNHLKPDMKIFEYGYSDSATLIDKCPQLLIVSVEHSLKTYYSINGIIKRVKNNYVYKHIPPQEDPKPFPYSHLSYGTTNKEYLYYNFKKYVNYITEYQDNYFDVTIINGFSRASCIMTAANKMRNHGILILNNSERYVYQDAISLFLSKYKVTHFNSKEKRTSIYEPHHPI